MNIKIKTKDIELKAELNDSETAKRIYKKLPINGDIKRWGDEIYFEIPLHIDLEDNATEILEEGDLGFWPEGDCFCIFFGKTPASRENEIRAASKVNVFGKVNNPLILKQTNDGDHISIEKQ